MPNRNINVERLLLEIEKTTDQVNDLLRDIHNNEINFTEVRSDLDNIASNMENLSALVKDGEHSLLVRVALAEQSISEAKISSDAGKWKFYAAMITSVIAVLGHGFTYILHLIK